jgi:antitoxin HicB
MRLEYAVRIERLSEENGCGFIALVPDLPGCMSDGETPEEALRNVQDAIGCWIEAAKELNREVPPPAPPFDLESRAIHPKRRDRTRKSC